MWEIHQEELCISVIDCCSSILWYESEIHFNRLLGLTNSSQLWIFMKMIREGFDPWISDMLSLDMQEDYSGILDHMSCCGQS